MDQYFTWNLLGTFAGGVTATALLTQLLKRLLKKVPTPLISFLVASLILIGVTAFTTGFTLEHILLIPINAALISFSSNGAFDAMKRMSKGKCDVPSSEKEEPPPKQPNDH